MEWGSPHDQAYGTTPPWERKHGNRRQGNAKHGNHKIKTIYIDNESVYNINEEKLPLKLRNQSSKCREKGENKQGSKGGGERKCKS